MGDAILFRVFVLLYLFCSFLSITLRVTRLSISDPFANVSQIVNRLLSTTLWRNSSEKNPFLTSSKFLLWIWSSFKIFILVAVPPVCYSLMHFMVGTISYHMTVTRHGFSRTPSSQKRIFKFMFISNFRRRSNHSTKESTLEPFVTRCVKVEDEYSHAVM